MTMMMLLLMMMMIMMTIMMTNDNDDDDNYMREGERTHITYCIYQNCLIYRITCNWEI